MSNLSVQSTSLLPRTSSSNSRRMVDLNAWLQLWEGSDSSQVSPPAGTMDMVFMASVTFPDLRWTKRKSLSPSGHLTPRNSSRLHAPMTAGRLEKSLASTMFQSDTSFPSSVPPLAYMDSITLVA